VGGTNHGDSQQLHLPYAKTRHRSLRRRFFLFLTEPNTSVGSALFFVVLVASILLMNIIMILQTMDCFQYIPTDCRTCGGPVSYLFDDDATIGFMSDPQNEERCTCPPTPYAWTESISKYLIYFFTVEWMLRIALFTPSPRAPDNSSSQSDDNKTLYWNEWMAYVFSAPMVLDGLAIFPYYIELTGYRTNGLVSLRLLRLFRVFQLVRLGQYNETFQSLTAVLSQSVVYLQLLVGIICFGATIFGSLLYWLEKGDWQYYEPTSSYQFVRFDVASGQYAISPFTSIPMAFWWWVVTATTVSTSTSF
jgi:Ion transport protein